MATRDESGDSGQLLLGARIVAVGLVLLVCLRLAWVGDDALITLRTALNISHGWGPGFNATEAVQGYTHPLWFLIWTAIGVATDQWIVGMLAVSLALTALAVGLLVWSTRSIPRIVVLVTLLVLSNAFVEYATSGLENGLAYATVATLMVLTLRPRRPAGMPAIVPAALAGLTVAAVLLTRLDLAVLVAPAVLWTAIIARHHWRLLGVALAACLVPLAGWFAWSYATYAALLPNTFDAKRNVAIPASELATQGLRYLWVSFQHDPVTLVAVALGVVVAATAGSAAARAWALGVVLYLGYVIWVGGDFMAGRFLAVLVLVSVFLVAVTPIPLAAQSEAPAHVTSRLALALGICAVLVLGTALSDATPVALTNPQTARWETTQNINAGVGDERGFYVALGRSLEDYVDRLSLEYVNPDFRSLGNREGLNRELRELDREARNWPTTDTYIAKPSDAGTFCGFIGTVGMATGPTVHLIDSCGLTDRFLASRRYFPASPFAWKPGHFERTVPEGYEQAILNSDPDLMKDPAEAFLLAKLWTRIRPPARG